MDTVRILNPEEPYDGPIKVKDKVQKISIDDLDKEEEEEKEEKEKQQKCTHENGGHQLKNVQENCKTPPSTNAGKVLKIADLNKFANRTHTCNELTGENVGEKVIICGWLEYLRLGKFLILRDSYGQTQVLLTDKVKEELNKKQTEGVVSLALESIVRVEGKVIPRPTSTVNPKMHTGQIEVEAEKVDILNPAAKNLPFVVRKFNRASEKMRLAHRYIDLR